MIRPVPLLLGLTALPLLGISTAKAQSKSASISNVHYDLTFDSTTAAGRIVQVGMTMDVGGSSPVLLSLPAWAPGHYDIMNFSRRVRHLAATQDGKPVTVARFDPDTWRIEPAGKGALTVTFEFRADTVQTGSAWSRPDFLYLNGTNVFLYPEGRGLDFPATVTVHTDKSWRVATGMHPTDAALTYGEKNYHDLTDMPFFIGRCDLDSAEIAGKWTRLATYPAGKFTGTPRAELWRTMRGFIPVESAVFGVTPWDNYTVFLAFPENFNGGTALEHQSSNLGVYSVGLIGNPALANTVAHEIFHAWNVKRLRPAEMMPYRYDQAQPTTLLWISEGFTDYYANIAEVRGSAIDSVEFAGNTLAEIQSVAAAPPLSVDENSLSVWVHPIDGTFFMYYDKGALIGMLLDIMIRDASDNHGSLDMVMRSLYESNYLKGRGFTREDFWSAVSRAAGGKSFDAFRDHYVAGMDPLPIDSIFPLAGLRHVTEKSRVPRLGVATAKVEDGEVVTQIVPGSPYAQGGGLVGDTILVLGGVKLSTDPGMTEFRKRWSSHEGDTFQVEIKRAGKRQNLAVKVALVDRVEDRLEFDSAASAKALKIRNGLLHGDGKQ